jgi:Fe-S-cluster containining protein
MVTFRESEVPSFFRTKKGCPGKPIYMSKSSSGACVYLEPHGCSIYDKRPAACREFDCRSFLKKHEDAASTYREDTRLQLEELFVAARAAIGRHKQSLAARFNAMLRGGR